MAEAAVAPGPQIHLNTCLTATSVEANAVVSFLYGVMVICLLFAAPKLESADVVIVIAPALSVVIVCTYFVIAVAADAGSDSQPHAPAAGRAAAELV